MRVEDPQLTDGRYELGWLWDMVGTQETEIAGPWSPSAWSQGPRAPLGTESLALPAEDLGHPAGNGSPAGDHTPLEPVLQAQGVKPPLRKIVSSKGLNSKRFHFPFL